MKRYFWVVLLLLPLSLVAQPDVEIFGSAVQGGMLRGKISTKVIDVFYNYQPLPISKQQFIIGFDRDEKVNHILTFVLRDGTMFSKRFSLQEPNYQIEEITLPASKKKYTAPLSAELLQRIDSEAQSLKQARAEIADNSSLLLAHNFTRAVAGGRISGVFGSQRFINGKPQRPHNGLDIAAPIGTPVLAMNRATVALTGDYFYNGKFVLLDHGLGLSSIYIHLSEISVEMGEQVESGAIIGTIGNTGRSTGPHLHWGISYRGKRLDPALTSELDNLFFSYPPENDFSSE
ncbi:MAG: M23 family metallopeptidase [Candidatus Cloacimonadales bacterium]